MPGGFERTGILNSSSLILLNAVTKLRANQRRGRSSLSPHLSKLSKVSDFGRDKVSDLMFKAQYNHVGEDSCASYAAKGQIQREERVKETPIIHYGTVASGNQVMRDGATRDRTSYEFGGVLYRWRRRA
jgi:hypothetical protein